MIWTEKNVETLKKLWEKGVNTKVIAKEIGGATSNSVVGKARRLKLGEHPNHRLYKKKDGRGSRFPDRQTARPKEASVIKNRWQPPRAMAAEIQATTRKEPAPTRLAEPISRKLKLVELNDSVCRWPSGEPSTADFSFCGNDADGKYLYCNYHRRLAFQPPLVRGR